MPRRILIVADIHANMTALEAVMTDVESHGTIDEIWCLGDLVGYGPDPCECIRFLREKCIICVAGNHDLAAAGKLDTFEFNASAAEAIAWTRQQLSEKDISYLGSLPFAIKRGQFTIVHGSPRDPVREYLTSVGIARGNFSVFDTRFCLVGHTHITQVFRQTNRPWCRVTELEYQFVISLGENRLIINPGAVGQPRDGDPRAAYAIIDLDKQELASWRVPYDIKAVQERMSEHGLPAGLIDRLSIGV